MARTRLPFSLAWQEAHPLDPCGAGMMFASSYSIGRLLAAIAMISAWTGLPQHAAELPRIQANAERWELLAIILPFLAALVLGIGTSSTGASPDNPQTSSLTYPVESQAEKWTAPLARYVTRLVISMLGTLGFLLSFLLIHFVLDKLGNE